MYLTFAKNEIGPLENAHEFINQMEFDLNNLVEQKIQGVLHERDDAADNEPIEEVDDMRIGDVVVDRVGFKDVGSAQVTLKQFQKQKAYRCYTSHPQQLEEIRS